MPFRQLKKEITTLLQRDDLNASLKALVRMPLRQVVNPLFGLLYHGDPVVRWHAVTAMGVVTTCMAKEQMESARVIMRRLMWNLNDESGGIGWGSPESMAEIMVRHTPLAREYAAILVSYLNPDGNFLEHEGLQEGVLWGLAVVATAQPDLVADAARHIPPFLTAENPSLRGLAARACGYLMSGDPHRDLIGLCSDNTRIDLYEDGRFTQPTVAELARKALAGIPEQPLNPEPVSG